MRNKGNFHYQFATRAIDSGERYHALLELAVAMHYYLKAGDKEDYENCKDDIIYLIRQVGLSENHFNIFDNYGRQIVHNNLNKKEYLNSIIESFLLIPEDKTQNKPLIIGDFPIYKNLETRYIGDRKNLN